MEKGDNDIRVFKRVSGEFMNVGKVVGQKPGSFSLWEDKHTLKGLDFAWHLDKITGVLKPFILSSSWKKITYYKNSLPIVEEILGNHPTDFFENFSFTDLNTGLGKTVAYYKNTLGK